jgi:hypothetical protein
MFIMCNYLNRLYYMEIYIKFHDIRNNFVENNSFFIMGLKITKTWNDYHIICEKNPCCNHYLNFLQ